MCSFAICRSTLVEGLLWSLAGCFLTRLFVFLLLNLKRSLYILDTNLLSDVSFVNIFSQPMAYFLILLMYIQLLKFNFTSNTTFYFL